MNNKMIIGIIAVIVIIAVGIGSYFLLNNKTDEKKNNPTINDSKSNNNENGNQNNEPEQNPTTPTANKTLVVYYSATGSTRRVAEQIAENLSADLFEIEPEDVYTSSDLDWTDNNSRVSREHDNESLRNVELRSTEVENWDDYDTVIIGYPIWWGIAAWPVDTFVKANDFSGKTVIPFCTSSSSGLGESEDLLEEIANNGNWQEGHRFNSGVSAPNIKTWTDSLN